MRPAGLQEKVTAVQQRPGFDLVRLGNVDEDEKRSPQEIAFFHHRTSTAQ